VHFDDRFRGVVEGVPGGLAVGGEPGGVDDVPVTSRAVLWMNSIISPSWLEANWVTVTPRSSAAFRTRACRSSRDRIGP
jgi:hypothetical protein